MTQSNIGSKSKFHFFLNNHLSFLCVLRVLRGGCYLINIFVHLNS